MSTGLLQIGSSALDAAYTALRTTGNNIANVNTPGYNRELTNLAAQVQTNTGTNYIGTGVSVSTISRVYSDFLGQQSNLAQAMSSQADSTVQLTGQINTMFSDSTNGLGASLDNLFKQLQSLSTQPGSAATRTTTLSAAQQLAGQFNGMFAQLQTMDQSVRQQMGQEVSTVNTTVAQIGKLNDQIALAQASGETPNTLLDQRNQAILTLNKSLGVTTVTNKNSGSIDLYLANGQPLLVGDQTFALTMGQDPVNAQKIVVGIQNGPSIAALDPNNSGGGTIGGLLKFQNQTIPDVENQVGRLAVVLSSQMNAIQALGTDQSGAAGSPFFTAPAVSALAASTNTGSATVSATISDATQLQASDYQLADVGGSYVLTRLADGQKTTLPSFPATVDGMTISSAGTMKSGDTFTLQPVHFGAQNIGVLLTQGSQIAAASPVQASVATTASLSVGNVALQGLSSLPNPNSNLLAPVTLTFTGPNSFTYTPTGGGAAVSATYTAGTPINLNGWSLTLNGTAAAGDTVTVSPSGSGSGDNRNALLMAQLQGLSAVSGSTLDSAYAAVVGSVGATASTALTDQASKSALLTAATGAQSSLSGVNLDEEAAKLMQYQQQYQAAAKLIQTAGNVFDAILQVAGAA